MINRNQTRTEEPAITDPQEQRGERIETLRRRVYHPAELTQYRWHERLLISIAAFLGFCLVYLIGRTIHWEIRNGIDRRGEVPVGQPSIYTFWHNRILPATWFFQDMGIVVMTSQSFDGEIIARMIQYFGYGASRGSTSRGGSRSLREMAACMQAGFHTSFTIDGPRGPVYVAKPGALQLAKLTGCPILPFCISTKGFWQLRSWDGFRIPKPFSPGLVNYGTPIYIARDCDEETFAAKQAQLQETLERLHQESEVWRTR
ncbi:MAG: lysophospholipid acyltransferase family protein [Acidobacteriota bacterium]